MSLDRLDDPIRQLNSFQGVGTSYLGAFTCPDRVYEIFEFQGKRLAAFRLDFFDLKDRAEQVILDEAGLAHVNTFKVDNP